MTGDRRGTALNGLALPWPAPTPRTPRMTLRGLRLSDTDQLLTYRGRADVCRYLPFEPMSADVLVGRLRTDLGRTELTGEGQGITWGAELIAPANGLAAGRLIGDVVLFLRSVEHSGGELGYVFHPEAAGAGYATEAARAVLALAFEQLGLHRVIARIDGRNQASARLAERLGMRREAHFRSNEVFKGEWSDELVYAILAEEWPG
jgi:RimJ/RimL family protein N-acetyltransferase